MWVVEFDGPPSWSIDASETGERTKYEFECKIILYLQLSLLKVVE